MVSLSVVTNVIPYIVALSALFVMMRNAGVSGSKYTLTAVVALIAMIYSTYAVYASGTSAVMGGVLVMCAGYIIWGLISPGFIVSAVMDRTVRQPQSVPLSQEVRHAT